MPDEFRVVPSSGRSLADLEARLRLAASAMQYPPTPDFAGSERRRFQLLHSDRLNGRRAPGKKPFSSRFKPRWAFAWVALILVAAGLFFVSPVRARVIEWLRVGAVRLHLGTGPTPETLTQPEALTDLTGEISLSEAGRLSPIPLKLPKYPPDLGLPQHIYLQQVNGADMAIMIWLQNDDPQSVRLALFQIGQGDVFQKALMENVTETSVNGEWALWVEGPYLLTTTGGQVVTRRIVHGHTLIWTANGLTYRLETDMPLREAIMTAQSLDTFTGQ